MSLEKPNSAESNESNEIESPNLLKDLEKCVDSVVLVETELAGVVGVKERDILKNQIAIALGFLKEKMGNVSENEMEKFKQRVATGFQGLGGFNRYVVRGDGSIGLTKSHSTTPCIKKAQELGIETPDFGF